ncbi:Flagellar basal-body rod protein FlgG [Rickettsia endosymbiont of Cardiosporidium cionae]|nr:Flagellar basal-body rod protein FlgG [Rickettsia endosymbiont of Cardiosporidium cionae]
MLLSIASTGLIAAEARLVAIANNVSNINSAGYKESHVRTADLFYNTLQRSGVAESQNSDLKPVNIQVGSGAKVVGITRNYQQGKMQNTNNNLDVAILGSGYFAISLPNGRVGYTRDGSFKRSSTGSVITNSGYTLLNDVAIATDVNLSDISISRQGTITVKDTDSVNVTELGQLRLFNFANEDGLESIGDNMYVSTTGSGEANEIANLESKFLQGCIEKSNVVVANAMVELITAQREYELNLRVIRVQDEISKDRNSIKS